MIRRIRNITAASVFLTVLLLASSAFGVTNWFVDTSLATGSNNGTSMDDAWQSIKTAMEYALYDTGENNVWIRRVSSFSSPSADITLGDSGGTSAFLSFIGWPRNSHAISSSDWTSGSTEVTVDDADMDREKHQGRYITGPDGRVYLITRVVDADTIIIDRPYIGSDSLNHAATISADEDYAKAQAISDSGWTIKKTDWNADADDVPKIDFGATNYKFYASSKYGVAFKNLEFSDGAASTTYYATLYVSSMSGYFQGCLFKQTNNGKSIYGGDLEIDRCTFEGAGATSGNTSNNAIYPFMGGVIKNSAIYGYRSYALQCTASGFLQNVNIGVEAPNGTNDIYLSGCYIVGYDVKLGGTNGYVAAASSRSFSKYPGLMIENYQKVLGEHQSFYMNALDCYKTDVVEGSGDPYKRSGGANSVLTVDPGNTSGTIYDHYDYKVLDIVVYADTSSKSYRFYVQTKDMSTLTYENLHVVCTYISDYVSATKYQTSIVQSDESVSARSDASDWSQYIEVTGIQPAIASNVHLQIFFQAADSDGYVFIDPLPYIY